MPAPRRAVVGGLAANLTDQQPLRTRRQIKALRRLGDGRQKHREGKKKTGQRTHQAATLAARAGEEKGANAPFPH